MVKNKKSKLTSNALTEAASRVGLLAMTAALTLSVLELPEDAKRVILPAQPAPAWVDASERAHDNSAIRREREETVPHFISYSEVQRTPTRSGRS